MKDIIHFSHANGFPAETYRKLFSFLEKDFVIGYISMHGHHPDYPVTDNWIELVKELVHYLEKNYQQPVIGVGHSLGGILTFLAAMQRPDLFKCIVMLDAPIPGALRSKMAMFAKWLRLIDRLTPAYRTKKRRVIWKNYQEAYEYFKAKPLFSHFDQDCLADYVRYGTKEAADGIHLKFDRQIEYQIFRTLPHNLPKYRGQLKVPGGLIYGEDSRIITTQDVSYMMKHFHLRCWPIIGGHLFPFEYPEETANILCRMICSFSFN